MEDVDLTNTYWDRYKGFVSELRVDARWTLRSFDDGQPYGSLRIGSFPDLPVGNLRAIFTYVTKIKKKTNIEKLQTLEDYQMDLNELEVYSITDDIKTETQEYIAPFKELQDMFGVKIFE